MQQFSKKRRNHLTTALVLSIAMGAHTAKADDKTDIQTSNIAPPALTLYQSGRGLFRTHQIVSLEDGLGRYEIANLPVSLRPDSVSLKLTSGDPARILSISQSALPASGGNLLDRYIGKEIRWKETNPVTGVTDYRNGVLIDNSNGLLVRFGDNYELFPEGSPVFGEDALKYVGKRALEFDAISDGDQAAQIASTFLADGFSWSTQYSLKLSRNGDRARMIGDAMITNNTQTHIDPSRITLVAGDIREEQAQTVGRPKMALMRSESVAMVAQDNAGGDVTAQSVQDRQLLMLPGLSDLPAHATKKVTFLETNTLPVERRYTSHGRVGGYEGRNANARDLPVGIEIRIDGKDLEKAAAEHGSLETGLPRGLVRIYDDEAQIPLLLGESTIADRAVGEDITLNIGAAFDLVVKRTQSRFDRLDDKGRFESEYQITMVNRSAKDVDLRHQEHVIGDWKVYETSHDFEEKDARRIEWAMTLKPGEEKTITYAVRVTP